MAEPLKDVLDPQAVRALAALLSRAWPDFPTERFVRRATKGLAGLELKARAQHLADALKDALPDDPTRAMELVIASLGPPLEQTEGTGTKGLALLPLSTFLHDVGPLDVETALRANRELTRRFTAEFSLRPLLQHAQARTLRELRAWAADPDPHVRRLVSEGTRPRLPWAERVPALQADPSLTLPLLERLKDDESAYVRRSVANHLNDLSKDHPRVVLDTARAWLEGASPERRQLVEHGLRTLVKAGQAEALALLGADGSALEVSGAVSPRRVRLGDSVTVHATVENRGRAPTHVVVEAVVHFPKPRGTSTRKFRLGRFELDGGATKTVQRRFAMVHRSIRRLHAGRHRVDVQANGTTAPAGAFELRLT